MDEAHFRQDSLPGIPAGLSVHNVLQKEILSAWGLAVEHLPLHLTSIPSTTHQDKTKYVWSYHPFQIALNDQLKTRHLPLLGILS